VSKLIDFVTTAAGGALFVHSGVLLGGGDDIGFWVAASLGCLAIVGGTAR